MQPNEPCPVYTNSCVQLSIPHEYLQSGTLTYQWCSFVNLQYQSHLVQFLLSQASIIKNTQHPFYICSPLDIGCNLSVKIQQHRYKHKIIVEQINYGYIKMQQNLYNSVISDQWKHLQIIFTRDIKRQALIQIKSDLFQSFNSNIKIIFKINNTEFSLHLNEEVAKTQLQLNLNQSFFKLYESESNTIGVFIAHQMSEFVQKLNQQRIFCHVQPHIKLSFRDRKCRDVFIFCLLSRSNISFQSVKQFRKSLSHISDKKQQAINIRSKQQITNRIPKIQSTIRSSQMLSFQLLKSSIAEKQNTQKNAENILQDIYNILYYPGNKIGIQQQNPQNETRAANNLQRPQWNQQIISQSTQFQNDIIKLAPQSPKRLTQNHTTMHFMQLPAVEQKKKTHISLKTMQSLTISRDQPQDKKNYFKKQLKEIDLLQKMNQLTKHNQQLIEQNKKLKEQNQKLKRAKQSQKINCQLSKMLEIKNMVQVMAQKLQQLENSHQRNNHAPLNSPRKSKNPYNLDHFGRIVQPEREIKHIQSFGMNQKRFWSPRAHQQIIKNIKQRNNDQRNQLKQSIQKNQRKRQQNQPVTPDNKQNNRAMKNYTSLTKNMHCSPLKQQQQQKSKKQAPTNNKSIQNNTILNNTQHFFPKSKQIHIKTPISTPQNKAKNLTIEHVASTPQNFFKNVYKH